MKKLILPIAAILILTLASPGEAQKRPKKDRGNAQQGQMIELYSQSTMGWEIEQRCQHLGEGLNTIFSEDYDYVTKFMTRMLGADGVADIQSGAVEALDGDSAFECGPKTINFASDAYRITRDLASSIRAMLAR